MSPLSSRPAPATVDPTRVLARDVMNTDVLTLRAEDTVESAVALFEDYHVSGAPVIDAAGHPIGVLTASDVTRSDHLNEGRLDAAALPSVDADDELEGGDIEGELLSREDYSPEVWGKVRVEDWMSTGIVTVTPEATLAEVCRLMLSESIHRVFVVEGERLRGVVSTFDVVGLLAGVGPEERKEKPRKRRAAKKGAESKERS